MNRLFAALAIAFFAFMVDDYASATHGTETYTGLVRLPQIKCPGGIPEGNCSGQQPKLCVNGQFVNKCQVCGCPTNMFCQEDGNCKYVLGLGKSGNIPLLKKYDPKPCVDFKPKGIKCGNIKMRKKNLGRK